MRLHLEHDMIVEDIGDAARYGHRWAPVDGRPAGPPTAPSGSYTGPARRSRSTRRPEPPTRRDQRCMPSGMGRSPVRTTLNNGPRGGRRGRAGPLKAVDAAVNAPGGGDNEFAPPVGVEGAPVWAGWSSRRATARVRPGPASKYRRCGTGRGRAGGAGSAPRLPARGEPGCPPERRATEEVTSGPPVLPVAVRGGGHAHGLSGALDAPGGSDRKLAEVLSSVGAARTIHVRCSRGSCRAATDTPDPGDRQQAL